MRGSTRPELRAPAAALALILVGTSAAPAWARPSVVAGPPPAFGVEARSGRPSIRPAPQLDPPVAGYVSALARAPSDAPASSSPRRRRRGTLAAAPLEAAGAACRASPAAPGGPPRSSEAPQVVDVTTRSGDSPWRVLRRVGLEGREVKKLLRALRPRRRLGRMRAGQEVRVAFEADGELRFARFRAELEVAWCVTRDDAGHYEVTRLRLPVEEELQVVKGAVLGSWAQALVAAGAPRGLGVQAANLFPEATRAGRSVPFRMVVERRTVEGRLLGYGPIEALEVDLGGMARSAFRFRRGGRDVYYDAEGAPLRQRRLPPPVLDAQLTSGYGRRWHPIRRRRRFHRGVDYGAALGEPVYAVATGTVSAAGYSGPLGRRVVIAHGRGLVTRYAHLRRIAAGLMRGDVVSSGELLGFVGSSGLSTGPHLHFETIRNGRHVDPLRYRPPPPPPLDAAAREAFRRRVSRLRAVLAAVVS